MSSSLLVCLCSAQGHGLRPISRPWLPWLQDMERVDGGVCMCVWLSFDGGGGNNSRVDMSVSQRPAGDWPLLPRRPLTPVETVPLQVAAGSLWKHLGPAWVIGHMGDSAIQETPAVPGMLLEAGSMAAYPNSHILVISSCSISTVCPNTTTCCNMQYTKSGLPLHITNIQTHIQCMHTHVRGNYRKHKVRPAASFPAYQICTIIIKTYYKMMNEHWLRTALCFTWS